MANDDIVVIGASAGGVGSLQRVVEHIPADFPAAILIAFEELRELTMHEDERDHPAEPSPYSCPGVRRRYCGS